MVLVVQLDLIQFPAWSRSHFQREVSHFTFFSTHGLLVIEQSSQAKKLGLHKGGRLIVFLKIIVRATTQHGMVLKNQFA